MSSSSLHLQSILRLPLTSPKIEEALKSITKGEPIPDPDIKSYPDAVYFNYYSLGLSLLYAPQDGYEPKTGAQYNDLAVDKLVLDSIDIYNVPKPTNPEETGKSGSSRSEIAFSTFVALPITLDLATNLKDKDGNPIERAASTVTFTTETTGKDVVSAMGEPDRKGGGAGPSNGSIGIWLEWFKDGVMIEFGGDQARGPQAWERGKDATWKVITIFKTYEL